LQLSVADHGEAHALSSPVAERTDCG